MRKLIMVLSLCISACAYGGEIARFDFEGNLTDSVGSYNGTAVGPVGYAYGGLAGGSQCLDLTCNGGVDGTYGVVLAGTEGVLDSPDTMSVALWFKAEVAAGDARWDAMVSKLGPGTSWDNQGWSARMYSDSEDLAFTTRLPSGGYGYTSGYNVRDGNWHHIVCTYSSAAYSTPDTHSQAKIYIDGELAKEYNVEGGLAMKTSATVPISIGVSIEDYGTGFNYRDGQYGYIDNVRIFDNAITATEVQNIYNSSMTIPLVTTQPKSTVVAAGDNAIFNIVGSGAFDSYEWYKSTDPNNDTPADDTLVGGNSATLTIAGAQLTNEAFYFCVLKSTLGDVASETAYLMTERVVANWGFESSLNDSVGGHDGSRVNTAVYDTGIIGSSALLINGDVGDVVTVPYSYELNTESYTFSAWVNVPVGASGSSVGIYSNRDTVAQQGSIAYYQSTTKWVTKVRSVSGTESGPTSVSTTDEGVWLFLVCTFEKTGDNSNGVEGILSIYMDGELDAQSSSVVFNPNTSLETVIGSLWSSTNSYYGVITCWLDDVKWYNYALSAAEVAQIYVDVMGGSICITQPTFDTNDDCVVNLSDFADFASHWLESNLVYPSN